MLWAESPGDKPENCFRCHNPFAIQAADMGRVKSIFLCGFLFLLTALAQAGTYTLLDGNTLTGDPISYDKNGVILKTGGGFSPRTPWAKFTQEALNQFVTVAKSPKDAAFIQPFLEETIQ